MDKSEMMKAFETARKEPTLVCLVCGCQENPFSDVADTGKAWLCGKCQSALRSFVENGTPKIRSNASLLNSMQICLNVDRDSNCLSECFGCDYINHKDHIMDMVRDAKIAIEELVCDVAEEHNARLDAEEKAARPVPNWISVDRNNLPGHEVIAVNAKPGSYGYKEMLVGMVFYSEEEGFFACESDEGAILINVTHYMEKPVLPDPPKEVQENV